MLREPVLTRDRARGSALFLVPAGILILMMLAAMAVDFSHLYLERRELLAATSAAANDAVTAIDQDLLRLDADARLELDVARVEAVAAATLAARGFTVAPTVAVTASPEGNPRVTVEVTRTVDHIFMGAVPGGAGSSTVTASSSAEAARE